LGHRTEIVRLDTAAAHSDHRMVGGKISLNCSLVPPSSSSDSLHTPNTPEILNTIVNISFSNPQLQKTSLPSLPSPSGYSDSSDSSSIASPLSPSYTSLFSPAGQSLGSSVQQYRSQFIKEGLKMKVKQNLKEEPEIDTKICIKQENQDITQEDVERRRRRRERNKVAATKCRNKKKEATVELIKESEVVEALNQSLKQELSRLEAEEKQLAQVLSLHSQSPSCCRPPKRRRMEEQEKPEGHQEPVFRVPELPDQSTAASNQSMSHQFSLQQEDKGDLYQVYSNLVHQRQPGSQGGHHSYTASNRGSLPSYPGYFDTMCLAI